VKKLRKTRVLIAVLAAMFVASAFGASSANAYSYYNFWPKPNSYNTQCNSVSTAALGGGLTTSWGNYNYGRYSTWIYVYGGYWHYGALYESGSNTSSSHTQTGFWTDAHLNVNPDTLKNNPFIRNNNASSIQACGHYEGTTG
jgi:hypothetical protein